MVFGAEAVIVLSPMPMRKMLSSFASVALMMVLSFVDIANHMSSLCLVCHKYKGFGYCYTTQKAKFSTKLSLMSFSGLQPIKFFLGKNNVSSNAILDVTL